MADFSYGGTRAQELKKFIKQPECFVMLLSKQGSVGLDLSFVTHIFFLDSMYDKALYAQVVARAYRMGATGPVFVEELTATDSVEEVMNRMNAGDQITLEAPSTDQKEKHAKLHKLLMSAKLIRPKQEPKIKKRKPAENDGVDTINGHQNGVLKKAAKTGGVRFG